ncbi:UDP-glucose 4-epimerase GalE [Inquilinus limosus]|uniref:UDP-glucose 4-epimerase GalE n=1 Tax=Inquilinus limosus TaxID=171674 RepID=UPI003F1385B6
MNHENPSVLVTGGAGYIGSHACKALAAAGFVPVTVDNLSRGHRGFVQWGPLEEADIGDGAALDRIMARHKPVAILHFAALTYVGESVSEPALYYRNNVSGSLSLLEAARRHGIGTVVFSSTCATYGPPERIPIAEDTPQHPIHPYGASKLMIERMLADFAAAYGLRWAALRYFNACGADPDGQIGEAHDPETHLIPLVLMAAAGHRPHIEILGDDYPTPDGTCIRDYIHVADLADAHVRALRYLLAGGPSRAFNLGTGTGHTVREVIAAVERVTGRPVPVRLSPPRPGDSPTLVADPSLAASALGFRPRFGLEESIRTAWHWYQRQSGGPSV